MELEVTVLKQVGSEFEDASEDMSELVRKALLAAARVSNYDGAKSEIGVVLTDDEGIALYHKQYFNDDSPTDVISFAATDSEVEPAVDGAPDDDTLGDIVVSTDTAKVQAQEYGHSVEKEIALLVIHGFLHLIGYDDCDDLSRQKMREAENAAMSLL